MTNMTETTTTIEGSNSLADLAARIKVEHTAVSDSLKASVRHGIAAGELLIEAKAQLKHGQWLPWLRDHVEISERTAQLYMRLAKNRTEIEAKSATAIADFTLNEAAALLMLSSDVRKLLALAKTMAGLEGEELVNFCIENDIGMLSGNIFNAPEPSDQERVEWSLFALFLARTFGYTVEGSFLHVDWVQSRGTLLADWMKPNPLRDAWMPIPQATFDAWNTFLEENRHKTLADVEAELRARMAEEAARPQPKRTRRRRAA
jgi:hypothetical protein